MLYLMRNIQNISPRFITVDSEDSSLAEVWVNDEGRVWVRYTEGGTAYAYAGDWGVVAVLHALLTAESLGAEVARIKRLARKVYNSDTEVWTVKVPSFG